jgi:putative Mn2+ efflux pump MntP
MMFWRELTSMFFSIMILAISLSLDALGVGIVYGFRRVKIPLSSKLIISLFSILYSGLAIIIGKSLSSLIPQFAKLCGVMILILMGIWIITQSLFNNKKESNDTSQNSMNSTQCSPGMPDQSGGDSRYPNSQHKIFPIPEGRLEQEVRTLCKIAIKSLGITIHIFRDPMEFDIDHSGIISTSESFLLGLALSVDAIGVGIGSGMMGLDSWLIPLAIGAFQMVFLYAGLFVGEKWSTVFKVNEKLLAVLPGTLLIALALIRLF